MTPHSVCLQFEQQARFYYSDACRLITRFTPSDFALLLLSCSVHYPLSTNSVILGTSLEVSELVHQALIFPTGKKTYSIPTFLWTRIEDDNESFDSSGIIQQWKKIEDEMVRLIPNLKFSDLHLPLAVWFKAEHDQTEVGLLWEKNLASSIAVKYRLCAIAQKQKKISLELVIPKTGLKGFFVDFSDGIIAMNTETFVDADVSPAVIGNWGFSTSHHDIILFATPNNIAIQCKNTLDTPEGSVVKKQLGPKPKAKPERPAKVATLIWFSLSSRVPEFKVPEVKDAIEKKRLVFQNGEGVVHPLFLKTLKLLKEIHK
jgi:hypothetical protein